jgi:hypothetical protein
MAKRLGENILECLLVTAAAAVLLPVPDLALAQAVVQNVDLAGTTKKYAAAEMSGLPNLISAVFYIGGTILVGAGLWKLKLHSENPGNTPLGHGVGRLAVGAGLLTIPFITQWAVNTLGASGAQTQYTGMNAVQ